MGREIRSSRGGGTGRSRGAGGERVTVVTYCRDSMGPLTTLWVSAEPLRRHGFDLEFVFTDSAMTPLRLIAARWVLFDSVVTLRRGWGPVCCALSALFRRRRAIYWHETEWAIEAARSTAAGFRPLQLIKGLTVRWVMGSPTVRHFHTCRRGCRLLRDTYRAREKRIHHLNECTDSERVLRYALPRAYEPGLFVGVGRAQHRKGVDLFLEIAQRVLAVRPEARFVWIGGFAGGDYSREFLTRRAGELGVEGRVELRGREADPLGTVILAEAFLLPSRDDPLPRVLQEALGLGRESVAFDVGGVPEIVSELDHVVPFGDVAAFAAPLIDRGGRRMSEEDQLLRRRRFRDRFTKEAFASRFERAFRSAWRDRAGKPEDGLTVHELDTLTREP